MPCCVKLNGLFYICSHVPWTSMAIIARHWPEYCERPCTCPSCALFTEWTSWCWPESRWLINSHIWTVKIHTTAVANRIRHVALIIGPFVHKKDVIVYICLFIIYWIKGTWCCENCGIINKCLFFLSLNNTFN